MKDTNLKLGRSIGDLIEENKRDWKENEEVIEIGLDMIRPNPEQPRTVFKEDSLKELSDSIKEHGVFQPIIVKPFGVNYTLVAGERRVKAARIAGLTTIPSIVRDYNSIYLSELAILENLQREDLTPIEEAIAFQKAVFNLKLTHEELGKKIGKSRVYITNIIGLLNLPTLVIQDVNLGKLSMGHARALSKLKDQELCLNLHQRILDEKLTVRDIEGIIRNLHKDNKEYLISNEILQVAENKLSRRFDTNYHYRLKKNQLVFTFESEEELDKLIKKITGGKDE
ncbi:Chromosome-partitioning protein Spo0J [Candidatus Izimaplasma bacterium HR1]|uniref:ParB/RepB/Spo0J family partition protein n=1 Tax=Candidatus Izimoplasma sp. HR1 TaxID=1541959 RepID=UPI0004F5DB61|nr:Chromosome-partitioning protein Spo0J [Candidatus Izimaplasma bacterium HR1]